MDSRIAGVLLVGVGLFCLATVGGVSGETGFESGGVAQGGDTTGLTAQENSTEGDGVLGWNSGPPGPFEEPGVYQVDVAEKSVISIEVIGPGGGGGAEDVSDDGGAADGGDGGYIHATFDVSGFSQIQITVGSGGGGAEPGSAGLGGDGYYDGGDGAVVDTLIGGWHTSGGGGGGATVVEAVHNGTTEPLAAAGGGGGGGAWDTYLGDSDNSGGGGGAAGGVGGTAEGALVGGGSDGNDAEQASGLIPNDIGGDGGDSAPSSVSPAGDGGAWVNSEFVETIEEELPGGGGAGGSGASGTAEDGADGAVTLNPLIVIDSLEIPETVTPEEELTVGYTLSNTGDAAGTESFVNLSVTGTDAGVVDSDQDVTVEPDTPVSGTLTFDAVGEFFAPGDTVDLTVELADFGDLQSGAVAVESGTAPEFVVDSLDYPTVIEPTEDLTVNYTVENVGNESGTESAVELLVDGSTVDSDTDVTLGPGETATGTLTFTGVEGSYGDGDTIPFTVALAAFEDSASGETDVQDLGSGPALVLSSVEAPASIPAGGDLDVGYTVENAGGESGTESAVELLVGGSTADSDTEVTVGAGETATGTLTDDVDGSFAPGETVQFTVELADFGDSAGGETDLLADGEMNLAIEPSSPVVEPGGTQSFEVVVEGADSGILGYQAVVVDVQDPGVGTITGFEEQFNSSGDGVFSNSEIQDSGATLYLEAATGASFAEPAAAVTVATFEVATTGTAGQTTGVSFDTGAAQTVAEFETGTPYTLDQYKNANLVLDAGDGPNIVLTDVTAPDTVDPGSELTVEYTVENFGDQAGTESAVELLADGSVADTDTNVSLGAGATASGTLTLDTGGYEPGDTIEWTVSLATFDDSESGQTTVPGPNLTLTSLDYPDSIGPGEDLEVGYTVENVGDAAGTESAVELVVADSVVGSNEDLTVGPGETVTGTLTYSGPGGSFTPGETVQFTVELAEFGDTESGETSVEASAAFDVEIIETNSPVVAGQELTVTAAVTNTGDAEGSSPVELSVDGLGTDSTTTTLGPGNSTQLSLGVTTGDGDAGNYTAEVTAGGVSYTAPVEVVADTGSPEFVVTDVETNAPLVEGEELAVTVTVENVGEVAGTQQVTVSADAFGEMSAELALEPGAVTSTTITVETEIGSAGQHTLTVATEDRSVEETIMLHLPVLPGNDAPPQDLSGDDRYRDLDGDSTFSIFDVQTFFNVFDDPAVRNHAWAYNFDGSSDGQITIFDVQALFSDL
jgi:hypothetical protein